MMLRPVSAEASHEGREKIERALARATSRAMRDFLADARGAFASLTAAATPLPEGEPPTLGHLAGRWAAQVDEDVVPAVREAFTLAWSRYTTLGLSMQSPQFAAMEAYVTQVRDRLVRGTFFGVTVYEESFEAVRRALAQSVSDGWSRQQLAQRIAAELAWETDGPYWRAALADVDYQIDAILDDLGEPGSPAREFARHNDPRVKALREQRNLAIRHLDAERSVWQTRANLIARTESTGAYNAGAQEAFVVEGVSKKMWLASFGPRTRVTHSDASGQIVGVRSAFEVGAGMLRFPGDPNGPVEEVANCRCTMIAGDDI